MKTCSKLKKSADVSSFLDQPRGTNKLISAYSVGLISDPYINFQKSDWAKSLWKKKKKKKKKKKTVQI